MQADKKVIRKPSSNQPCGRDSEYLTGAFLKSFSINSISNEGIHDIVLIFTYVAPEKSSIYSPENDDGIVILNERNIHD